MIQSGSVNFDPSFELFADTLLLLLNSFPEAIYSFPRIEMKFYQKFREENQSIDYLRVFFRLSKFQIHFQLNFNANIWFWIENEWFK